MTPYQQDRIRRRAQELWEREGRPEGHSERHWQQAKTMIASERGQKPVLPSMLITGALRGKHRGN
jgi:hypothetical protein